MYREYKNVDKNEILNTLSNKLEGTDGFSTLMSHLETTLNSQAPLKCKTVRGNSKPHNIKTLSKKITKRSRLKNSYNKLRSEADFKKYKKQRNKVVNMNKSLKKQYLKSNSPSRKQVKIFGNSVSHTLPTRK